MDKKNNSSMVYVIVMTALLTAIAVVVNFFRVDLPIAGAPVMRISFAGPFIRFVPIVFGPLYGGIAGGLLDVISIIIKPSGAYIPPLTLTAILNGALVGILWKSVKKVDIKKLKNLYVISLIVVAIIGIANFVAKTFMPESVLGRFVLSIGKKASYSAEGFIMAAVVGLILLVIADWVGKKDEYTYQIYLKIIITIGIPSIIITTINTEILRLFIPVLSDKMFLLIVIPRLMEDLIMLPIQAYIIVILMSVYEKVNKKKLL